MTRKEKEVQLAMDRPRFAFECEYCGTAYIVDLMSHAIDCPGCGHPPPYAQLQSALSPPLFQADVMDPRDEYALISGSVVDLRDYELGDVMVSGSVQAYETGQGNNLVERCRIDGKARAVGISGLCRVHGGHTNAEIGRGQQNG